MKEDPVTSEWIHAAIVARAAYFDAAESMVNAVMVAFQPGARVHWDRRGYRQTGEVVGWLGTHTAEGLRVRVLNINTEKVVDVHVGDIEELAP